MIQDRADRIHMLLLDFLDFIFRLWRHCDPAGQIRDECDPTRQVWHSPSRHDSPPRRHSSPPGQQHPTANNLPRLRRMRLLRIR